MSKERGIKNQGNVSTETLSVKPINLTEVITKLHPQIAHTPVVQTTVDIICGLKPLLLFENDPIAKSHAVGEIDDRIVRGSLVKRWELGTPEGYGEIKDVFQDIAQKNTNNELTNKIVSKLSEGPIEIDLRFKWKEGLEDSVTPSIISTLLSTGYVLNTTNEDVYFTKNDISVSLSSLEIGSKTYPRKLHNITFMKDDKKIFILDIANLPNEILFKDEMRLSVESGFFELYATQRLNITEQDVFVLQDQDLKRIWEYTQGRGKLAYSFGHILREVGNMVFWPKKYKALDTYELLPLLDYFKNMGALYAKKGLADSRENNLFIKRKESYVSDMVLYTTFDPFLFLYLGKQADLFTDLPLQKILNSGVEWDDFLLHFSKSIASEIGFEGDITMESIPLLAAHYKKSVLTNPERNINHIGPIQLIKAVNTYEGPNGKMEQHPETLDSFIKLVANPIHV